MTPTTYALFCMGDSLHVSLSNRTFEHMDEDGLAKMRCVARLGRGTHARGGGGQKNPPNPKSDAEQARLTSARAGVIELSSPSSSLASLWPTSCNFSSQRGLFFFLLFAPAVTGEPNLSGPVL
jgi:hypothetical protein